MTALIGTIQLPRLLTLSIKQVIPNMVVDHLRLLVCNYAEPLVSHEGKQARSVPSLLVNDSNRRSSSRLSWKTLIVRAVRSCGKDLRTTLLWCDGANLRRSHRQVVIQQLRQVRQQMGRFSSLVSRCGPCSTVPINAVN
jgi:hypothetical protein